MRKLIFIVVLAVTTTAVAEFPGKIRIGDKEITCLTVAEIRKLGFECEDVPWKDNAARLYIEAMNLYQEPAQEVDKVLTQASRDFDFRGQEDAVRAHFKRNQRAIDLIVEGAKLRYAPPMDKSEPIPRAILSVLTGYGRLVDDIIYRAAHDFSRGRQREAIDKCFLAIHFGRRIGRGHFLISYLMGVSVQGMGLNELDRMVASGRMNDDMLKQVAEGLARAAAQADAYEHAVRCCRIASLRTTDLVPWKPNVRPEQVEEMRKKLGLPPGTRLDRKGARRRLEIMYEFVKKWNRMPPWKALKPANHPDNFLRDNPVGWDPSVQALIPAIAKLRITSARHRIQYDVAELRVAIERYKLAHRRYPDQLDVLTPKYLAKVPTDPFSGKSYRYRADKDKGFVLWSIGKNLTDDNAAYDGKHPWSGPDFVFTGRLGP